MSEAGAGRARGRARGRPPGAGTPELGEQVEEGGNGDGNG